MFETFIVTLTGDFEGEQDFREFPIEEHMKEEFPGIDPKWLPLWKSACDTLNKREGTKFRNLRI